MSASTSSNFSESVVPVSDLNKALEEFASLEATLYRCSQNLTRERFRSGESYYASEPSLGLSVVQSIADIEKGEGALRPLLTYLQDLMRRAERQKMHNRAFVSAIRRLPHELLAMIFLLVAEEERSCSPGQVACYSFAHVCHTWRAVAHGTTELWTSISIRPTERTSHPAILANELMLSGERPLDVRLIYDRSQTRRLIIPTKSWDHLQKQSYRWRTLTLDAGFSVFSAMTPKPITCPLLEAVSIQHNQLGVHEVSHSDEPKCLLSELSCAPVLRTIDIYIDQFLGGFSKVRFPHTWTLTNITLSVASCDGGPSRFLPILDQNSNTLERLNFSILVTQWRGPSLDTSSVCMPKLTELTCRFKGATIVSYIDAPALTSLTIHGRAAARDRQPPGNLPSISQRIEAYRSLAKLSITDVNWPTAKLMAILSSLSNLESLELEESHNTSFGKLITERLCRSLTNPPSTNMDIIDSVSAPCPLPHLSCLLVTVYCAAATSAPEIITAIRNMGSSRVNGRNGVMPLSSFACRYRSSETKELVNIHHWGLDDELL